MVENPLAQAPMSGHQLRIILCCMALTAVDGIDMLAIGFAGPGITAEWHVPPALLGTIFAAELFGLAIGSVLFGRLADRIGRKRVILLGLTLMAATMLGVVFAHSITQISLLRLMTGAGIGAVLVGTNALAAEYANQRSRDTVITGMALGLPIGTLIGGLVATHLLREGGWRDIFLFGGGLTAGLLPLACVGLRESIDFLGRGGAMSQQKANRILSEFGLAPVAWEAAAQSQQSGGLGWRGLVERRLAVRTLLVTTALFSHFMTAFFLLKWIPKLVSDFGFHPSVAGTVLVWASAGGLFGAAVLSAATMKRNPATLVMVALAVAALGVGLFGRMPANLHVLDFVAFMANAGANAATVGLFALAVRSFPPELRGAGLGIAMGLGRGGAALGPLLGGIFLSNGMNLAHVTLTLACGSLIAVFAVFALDRSLPHLATPRSSAA